MKRKTNPENGKTLKKLWDHIAKFRVLLILSVLMAGVTVVLQLYVPILFGDAIDNIVAAGKVDFAMVGFYLKRVVILAVLSGVTGWVMSVINNRMTYHVVEDLRFNAIKRLQKLESICSSYDGVEKSYALQAGREIRVMVVPEAVNDEKMVLIARQIAKQIETEMDYPGQIKINLIRESRVVDYAK